MGLTVPCLMIPCLLHVVRCHVHVVQCDPFSVLLDLLRHRVDMWPPSQ